MRRGFYLRAAEDPSADDADGRRWGTHTVLHLRKSALTCGQLSGILPATMDLKQIVHSDPEIVSGTAVFVGTRVPAQALFDYLEGGETIDEFLDDFPSVSREQAIAFSKRRGGRCWQGSSGVPGAGRG